jgi:uncharacterized membrane protein
MQKATKISGFMHAPRISSSEPKTTSNVLIGRGCEVGLALAILLYCLIFLRLTFALFDRCAYMSFDLAIFDQAVWLISRGETPFVTVRGLHVLADHFSVILYLIAPLYGVAATPKTLLFVQTIALALGAVPVYWLAIAKRLPNWTALLFSCVYLFYPAIQWSNVCEFHPDTLATPFLIAAFYGLCQSQTRLYFFCLFVACLTKETAGLTVIFVGIYALIQGKKQLGLQAIILGTLSLVVATGVVGHFNQAPSPYPYLYEHWGKLGVRAAVGLVWQISWGSWFYYLKLLVPVLFLALAAPEVLLLALPTLAANLLSNRMGMNDIEEQYTALLTPFILAAAVMGYARIAPRLGGFGKAAILANLAIWAVGGSLLWGPFSRDTQTLYSHRTQNSAQETRRLLASIPSDASVSAQMSLGAQVSGRRTIYHFPNPFQKIVYGGTRQALVEIAALDSAHLTPEFAANVRHAPVEYVAINPNAAHFPLSFNACMEAATILLKTPSYGVEAVGQGLILLRRGADYNKGLSKLAAYTQKDTRDPERLLWAWLEISGGLDN